ncbi:ribose transport system permease protein [Rhizobiales bacterium GAS188]|nr:ribose transport system permease protein [Rhizobiales bacterium GAS188]
MAATADLDAEPRSTPARAPGELWGGWEIGILVLMAGLYLAGAFVNPAFFGTTDALSAVLRDTARYGVMAVGMTFVIVNRELDLSVGSTLGLVSTLFSIAYAPSNADAGIGVAIAICLAAGLTVGFLNGALVTVLRVPAFIATLSTLFIGRGLVLGLSGGKTIAFDQKSAADPWFFRLGESNALGFNNQILIFILVALIGAVALAKTRAGYETASVGGNEQAARYAGIATRRVRIRSYVLSALAATLAGLMNVAQDKGITSQTGQGAELIVIAAVIVGGASIAGGRGRVLGACLGAALTVLIDKVLREGVPITRLIDVGGVEMQVGAMAQLPPGAVPAFLGLLLIGAVLVQPWAAGGGPRRLLARLAGRSLPALLARGDIAIAGVQTRGTAVLDRALGARNSRFFGAFAAFLARRDAAAILLTLALWLVGLALRPDFWAGLGNSFAMLTAFTEIGILCVGLTFVIAAGDIDLSVGSVLALAAAVAAFSLKELELSPLLAVTLALAAGLACGMLNGILTIRFGLPSFVATLGTFYVARGLAAWMVAGRQLSGFPDDFTLIGRSLAEVLAAFGAAPGSGWWLAFTSAVSVQTLFLGVLAILATLVLARTHWGQMVLATGGNERAARYAGIDTRRVRFLSLVASSLCAASAGVIYAAYLRSFNPSAGQLRELDAIASVIVGGGSIFGGHGTIIGSLAGAAAITLIRSLLSLQILLPGGGSYVLPQHWMNVFIGLILIAAVIADIWLRQEHVLGRWLARFAKGKTA